MFKWWAERGKGAGGRGAEQLIDVCCGPSANPDERSHLKCHAFHRSPFSLHTGTQHGHVE